MKKISRSKLSVAQHEDWRTGRVVKRGPSH